MNPETVLSQNAYVKGLAVELPFFKFTYLKMDGRKAETLSSQDRIGIQTTRERAYTRRTATSSAMPQGATITTLGADPLVSRAAVVHELYYGRPSAEASFSLSGLGYSSPAPPRAGYIDLVV